MSWAYSIWNNFDGIFGRLSLSNFQPLLEYQRTILILSFHLFATLNKKNSFRDSLQTCCWQSKEWRKCPMNCEVLLSWHLWQYYTMHVDFFSFLFMAFINLIYLSLSTWFCTWNHLYEAFLIKWWFKKGTVPETEKQSNNSFLFFLFDYPWIKCVNSIEKKDNKWK